MSDVLFVNDTSSGTNWGSQATSKALRKLILDADSNIRATRYKSTLRKFESNPHLDARQYLPSAIRNFAESALRFDLPGMYNSTRFKDALPRRYAQFEEYADAALEGGVFESTLDRISEVDTLVINGEGLVYTSEDRCTRHLFFLAYIAKELLDTECFVVNLTIDPYDDTILKMAEKVLPMVDGVVFREPVSAQKYGNLCQTSSSGADPVFSMRNYNSRQEMIEDYDKGKIDVRPYGDRDFDPSEPYVCVAGSSKFPTESSYNVEGYRQLCGGLKNMGIQVLLIVSAKSDEKLLAPVSEEMDVSMLGLNVSIEDSLKVMSNSSLYIGGRYHPMIFSAKGGVPIIPLSANTHKIEGLLQLLNLDRYVYDCLTFHEQIDEILDKSRSYLDDPSEFESTKEKSDELAEKARLNVKHLESI